MKMKYKTLLAAGLLAAVFGEALAAGTLVEEKTILAGKVTAAAAIGAAVKEGDALVTVETLAGPVAAAKATADGIVRDILVKEGDTIGKQTVVAIIETEEKE